jgi:hypothetical protein
MPLMCSFEGSVLHFQKRMRGAHPSRQPGRLPYFFSLPNDILILILEYFTLNDLINLQKLVQQCQTSSSTSTSYHSFLNIPNPYSNLLHLLKHCDGHLFHKLALDPETLNLLLRLDVCVTKLRFLDYNEDSSRYLIQYKESIQEIDFRLSSELTDYPFDQLGPCPSLTSLKLASCAEIFDFTLEEFLVLNPQIQSLNISSMPYLDIGIIEGLHENLRHLDVSGNDWFDHDCLQALISLPRLKSLNVSETSIRINSVVEFLKLKPSLFSVGYSADLPDLSEEVKGFLMEVALRALKSDDLLCFNLGLENIHAFLKVDNDWAFASIRSAGVMPSIFRSVSHPVVLFVS